MAVSYTVSVGRRWSLLEQLLLVELATSRRSMPELTQLTGMPDRLIVEALINLLRANWVEVRSTEAGVFFSATGAGKRRAADEILPAELQQEVRWISLCMDRLTGSWFRADELELVYEKDLPEHAEVIEPRIHTYDPNDGSVRELFYLNMDESLEPTVPNFRTPSKPYARVEVAFDKVEAGLPDYAPLRLQQAIIEASTNIQDVRLGLTSKAKQLGSSPLRDTLSSDDIIVGGSEHFGLIQECFERAKTHLILHSCFVSPHTVRKLLPDIERAARRKVRVDLLWGLHSDPEDPMSRRPIAEAEKVLNELPASLRPRVQLSPISSGSHAKIVLYDERSTGTWVSIIGSCNFLSSDFDWIEASIRSRSQRLAVQLLGKLIASQLPAVGSWSPVARRLNSLWSRLRQQAQDIPENGIHEIRLLADQDHYACITHARDVAAENIVIGCDLYGLAAETSVLVPMERAAETGRKVSLFYNRASKLLTQEGRTPDPVAIQKRGMMIESVPEFHAKFLLWDEQAMAITSFNWMSTVVQGGRTKGAELGLLVEGPELRTIFAEKLALSSGGKVDIRPKKHEPETDLSWINLVSENR
ncbi:phospholipase D-like domain-containing protein [Microvirga sesbaniae]|uniref:phospholipase D-like domain-containing protein n=1 Tax=Microvirga sesbaniae TaxID=681392 RepID=UPI0021CA9A66|nr:phospholipase D-like domain-containing protein [Microvirga sp. HBU67692]